MDATGGRAGVARAEWLPIELGSAATRAAHLAAAAVRQALARPALAQPRSHNNVQASRARPALFIALAEAERPDQREIAAAPAAWLERVAELSGGAFDAGRSRIVRAGHAGFALALSQAIESLVGSDQREVLVGGAESPFDAGAIRWLDERRRLCRADDDAGRIIAEGAAVLRVTKRARARSDASLASIRSVDFEPLRAPAPAADPTAAVRGSAKMVGSLVRRVALPDGVDWLLPTLTGEPARIEAWAESYATAAELLDERTTVEDLPRRQATSAQRRVRCSRRSRSRSRVLASRKRRAPWS
ncbi:MAG: hypothetical protein U0271_15745 [Polyangiaceae bacterium]